MSSIQQMQRSSINLAKDGVKISCEKCGSNFFRDVFYLYKVSKLLTGDQQDTIAPIPTFQCATCGHVNQEFSIDKENKIVADPS